MNLPYWVNAEILKFIAPTTGRVEIALEIYNNHVTKMEIGGIVRCKPNGGNEVANGRITWPSPEERKKSMEAE